MKQPEDTKTPDMLAPAPPKRGRPPGDGKSAAERQRERRERLKREGVVQLTVEVPADVMAALNKFLKFKDETKSDVVVRILRDRLLRKR